MNRISTSFSDKGVVLSWSGNLLVVDRLPEFEIFDDCLFWIIDESGKEVWKRQFVRRRHGLFHNDKLSVHLLPGKVYHFCCVQRNKCTTCSVFKCTGCSGNKCTGLTA